MFKPPITLSSLDLDRIEALLAAIPASVFPNKAQLQSELDRADVLAPEQMPATVVTMNSTVKFSIEETGKEFCLTLVYPRDMDGSTDRISIFAPVGSPAGPVRGRFTGLARTWRQNHDGSCDGNHLSARARRRTSSLNRGRRSKMAP